MPAPERNGRHQKAVLWPAEGDDNYGRKLVGYPREILVRWVDELREQLAPDGRTINTIATLVVDEDISPNSVMWKGCIKDMPLNKTPTSDIYQVSTVSKTPDIKGRNFYREVGLTRFNGKLPVEGS